jgi:hypothetical protein
VRQRPAAHSLSARRTRLPAAVSTPNAAGEPASISTQARNPRRERVATSRLAIALPAGKKLQLNIGETSIAVPFEPEQAQQLDAAFKKLMETFAQKAKAERPKRWDMMECRFAGSEEQALQLMEFSSNPNACSDPFSAKVLVIIATRDGIKITTEARLSTLRADLDSYLKS